MAAHEDARLKREGKPALVEPGDIEAALKMSNQFGDDGSGHGSHGTGAQRQAAFGRGWKGATLAACNAGHGVSKATGGAA
jgi:predicted metalloprotease